MDYVQNAFYEASHWNRDNSYGSLEDTARSNIFLPFAFALAPPFLFFYILFFLIYLSPLLVQKKIHKLTHKPFLPLFSSPLLGLLDFPTPHGLQLNVSSLSSPNFATSYKLGSTGLINGYLSYLYTSLPLSTLVAKSSLIPLPALVPGYRQLHYLRLPDQPWWWEIWHQGKRVDKRDALLYGRLYLPNPTLEALYLRRLSPRSQLRVSCVSDHRLPNGGSILALLQHDTARHSTEYIYSTDSALLGFRGLYNFGPEPSLLAPPPTVGISSSLAPSQTQSPPPQTPPPSPPHGRFSAGFELYYSPLNKSSGTSAGLRFATLPAHPGFPYTMTLTLNPLVGGLSTTYSVRASSRLALSSRFDFNVYSYESGLRVGAELWRLKRLGREIGGAGAQKKRRNAPAEVEDDIAGVLKARLDQTGEIALLWEGRFKELVYGCGATVDFRLGENMLRGIGLEICYSS